MVSSSFLFGNLFPFNKGYILFPLFLFNKGYTSLYTGTQVYYMAKSMSTPDRHTHLYVFYFTKSSYQVHNCQFLCMLEHFNFQKLELRSPNLFQHDNDPVHKAQSSVVYEGWSGLNPIEHLWMKDWTPKFLTQHHLTNAPVAERTQIPTAALQHLVENLSNRKEWSLL